MNRKSPSKLKNHIKLLDQAKEVFEEKINLFQYSQLLKHVWGIINDANTLVQNGKPWEREVDQQDAIIFLSMETSRILSILCQPIMPALSQSLLDRIDVSEERRTIPSLNWGPTKRMGNTLMRGAEKYH